MDAAQVDITVEQLHTGHTIDIAAKLLNGCDVLIVTPLALKRYLIDFRLHSGGRQLINLTRCCHLVIENAHITLSEFREEVHMILKEFRDPSLEMKPLMTHDRPFQQLIVISEIASTAIRDFKASVFKYQVCPGSGYGQTFW